MACVCAYAFSKSHRYICPIEMKVPPFDAEWSITYDSSTIQNRQSHRKIIFLTIFNQIATLHRVTRQSHMLNIRFVINPSKTDNHTIQNRLSHHRQIHTGFSKNGLIGSEIVDSEVKMCSEASESILRKIYNRLYI